jgi:alpha/beta superfamily hydrolase
MYPAGNIFISVPHGRLEAIIKEPPIKPAAGAALVLHPLPTGGGTMHNKVVFRAAATLNDAGLITLRLNFRGVGQSTAEFDNGIGELEDARAGLKYLEANYPAQPLTVCGFSFGARVGSAVGIADDRVHYLISLGTPVDKYDFDFLKTCRKPILLVHGELDEFGDVQRLRALVQALEKTTAVQLTVIPGADHFFDGHLDEVKQAIFDWISARLNETK